MSTETTEQYFQYYTQKIGDISRQLGLAGAIITWTFDYSLNLPGFHPTLLWALALIVFSLLVDVAQYAVGAILWKQAWLEDSTKLAKNCTGIVNTTLGFTAVKVVLMMASYIVLGTFFLSNLT
jgi:hypothetical protein